MIGRTNALLRPLVSSVNGLTGIVEINAGNVPYDRTEEYNRGTVGHGIKKFLIVSETQPTDDDNLLWFGGENEDIQIPTYTEFQTSISNFAKPYDSTKTYTAGKYATYENGLYRSKVDISTPEEWNLTHWDSVTICEVLETLASTLSELQAIVLENG